MIITSRMDLDQLRERMGDVATEDEASVMRDLLVAHEKKTGISDTFDVSEADWMAMLEEAVAKARSDT